MSHTSNQSFHDLDKAYYLQTFKRFPIAMQSGSGSVLSDVEGKTYIDMLAGIAVNSIGHSHPKLVETIKDQAERLLHISNFYVSEPQVMLAARLTQISDMQRVFFTNSGAESVEGAIKIARKFAHKNDRGGEVISFTGAFHGRTMATIATGKAEMQRGFEPIPQGFHQAMFNDIDSVKSLISKETAAIIIEPIQGEGGINVADRSFLEAIRSICDDHGIVLIFDEIQCGVGRTGRWFAKDYFGVEPDIMTLAKALGGGVPIGAILTNEKVGSAIDFGDHGTTFGGNPLVCACALTNLKIIEEENLLGAATEKGEWLKSRIEALDEPSIKEVRGLGLMLGVVFDFETKPLVAELLNRGVLANATAGNVLRLVPPLNIEYDHLEKVVQLLKEAIISIKEHG